MTKSNKKIKILLADDDKDYINLFAPLAEGEDRKIYTAFTPEEVMKECGKRFFDVVFLDYSFNGKGLGIGLLKKIKKKFPDTVVSIITGKGTKTVAMESMRWGAFSYIDKADSPEINKSKINRILDLFKYGEENKDAKIENNLVGMNGAEQIQKMISKFATHDDAVVLITGQSGTGKDVVAKNVHLSSARNNGPFLSFNFCSVPDNLAENILFGYKKGAFKGAGKDTNGLLHQAEEGTLFLDEVGSASLNLQLKILHMLETGEFFRVGDIKPQRLKARLIFATNENMEALIKEGKFRKDLYYRINTMHIKVPPLREQKKDIPVIVGNILYRLYKKHNIYRDISPEIIKVCEKFSWDGNVRELTGALERCLLLSNARETISKTLLYKYHTPFSFESKDSFSGNTLKEKVAHFEKEIIQEALNKTKTQKQAAKVLGVLEATLSEKIKRYHLKSK